MSSVFSRIEFEHWHWLGAQIRCAMHPDDPRLLAQYLSAASHIGGRKNSPFSPFNLLDQASALLMDTATNALLPLDWRLHCQQTAIEALRRLTSVAATHDHQQRLRQRESQLAKLHVPPSVIYDR